MNFVPNFNISGAADKNLNYVSDNEGSEFSIRTWLNYFKPSFNLNAAVYGIPALEQRQGLKLPSFKSIFIASFTP